jgi:hypothetical protein
MLLSIIIVLCSMHIHVVIMLFISLSANIVVISYSIYIHVPIMSSIPLSADRLLKHNYAQKDE